MGEKLKDYEIQTVIRELDKHRRGGERPLDTLKRLAERKSLTGMLKEIQDKATLFLPPIDRTMASRAELALLDILELCESPITSEPVGTFPKDTILELVNTALKPHWDLAACGCPTCEALRQIRRLIKDAPLTESGGKHYEQWCQAESEVDDLRRQLDVAHERVGEVEQERDEAKKDSGQRRKEMREMDRVLDEAQKDRVRLLKEWCEMQRQRDEARAALANQPVELGVRERTVNIPMGMAYVNDLGLVAIRDAQISAVRPYAQRIIVHRDRLGTPPKRNSPPINDDSRLDLSDYPEDTPPAPTPVSIEKLWCNWPENATPLTICGERAYGLVKWQPRCPVHGGPPAPPPPRVGDVIKAALITAKPTCDFRMPRKSFEQANVVICGKAAFLEVNGHWRCKEHTSVVMTEPGPQPAATCDYEKNMLKNVQPHRNPKWVKLPCGKPAVCTEGNHPRCADCRVKVEEIKEAENA